MIETDSDRPRYADAPSASEIAARCGRSPSVQPLAASQPSLRDVEAEVHHPLGDVHAGRRDAVAELHRVVHFVHEQPAIGILEQIERHHAAAAGPGRARADVGELRRDRAVARRAAARGVGDPVRRGAIDRADRLRSDLERADVAARLLHVFLDVEDAVVIAAERFLVLEDRLGGVAIVDLAQQASPRTRRSA